MKMADANNVTQTHKTGVKVAIEFREDEKISLRIGNRFFNKRPTLAIKIAGEGAKNYWLPRVVTVATCGHIGQTSETLCSYIVRRNKFILNGEVMVALADDALLAAVCEKCGDEGRHAQ